MGLGLTLAHQYFDQLPPDIRSGINANTRNKIFFGLNSVDARIAAGMAPELSIEDFMSLPRYQIYTSFQSAGKSTGWIQGRTLPPPPVLRDATELKAQSQSSYGMSAEQIEAEYFEMFSNDHISEEEWENSSIGRRKRL